MDKYERCVLSVKNKQSASCKKTQWKGKSCYNPWAVCTKTVGRSIKSTRKSTKKSVRKSTKKSVRKSTKSL